MIIFLLLVIIAILLMGSSVFLGIVGVVLGGAFAMIAFAMLLDLWDSWSGLTQGLVVGIPAALAFGTWAYFERKKLARMPDPKALPPGFSRLPGGRVISSAAYVWATFADALEGRLSPEADQHVQSLIQRNAEQELSRFCHAEVDRIHGERASEVLRLSVANSIRRR